MKAFKVRRNDQDYFRVELPMNLFPDGKRRSVMAKTRREALEKADELLQQRKKGLKTEEAKASLADFLQRFLSFYKTEGGVALRTWQDYRYHIDENIIPGIGAIPLSELRPREVDLWMKSLRERGLGPRTVEYAQAVLRRALQFAVEWEIFGSKSGRRAVPRREAKESREFWGETHSFSRSRGSQKVPRRSRGRPSCGVIYARGHDRTPAGGAVWIALERREYRGPAFDGQSGTFKDETQEGRESATVPIRPSED